MASQYIYLLSSSNSNSSCVRFEWSSKSFFSAFSPSRVTNGSSCVLGVLLPCWGRSINTCLYIYYLLSKATIAGRCEGAWQCKRVVWWSWVLAMLSHQLTSNYTHTHNRWEQVRDKVSLVASHENQVKCTYTRTHCNSCVLVVYISVSTTNKHQSSIERLHSKRLSRQPENSRNNLLEVRISLAGQQWPQYRPFQWCVQHILLFVSILWQPVKGQWYVPLLIAPNPL